ncbi:hypothetical protein VNO78_01410 [Psophocarpus tetragonolobus]|uniref:Uncharacterized protein n=1 Tax=Psophocarpus tetragonolobus TaxID=3891 RepID=A0AAN9XUN9_PSOTE
MDLGRQGCYELPSHYYLAKQPDVEESSCQRGKLQRISSEMGKARTNLTFQQAKTTPNGVVNRDHNAIPGNPTPCGPREFVNTVYDIEFERNGAPIDPHLRLFKPPRTNVPGLCKPRIKVREFSEAVKLDDVN